MLAGIATTGDGGAVAKRRQSVGRRRRGLADRIHPMLLVLGPAVLVGISTDHPSTSFLPKALHEATIALDFANVTKRVVQFSDLPIRDLLLHRSADYLQSAPPHWITGLVEADRKAAGCSATAGGPDAAEIRSGPIWASIQNCLARSRDNDLTS